MKIEAGKYYRTSNGMKVGPMIDRNPGPSERTKWKDAFGRCWYADGTGFWPAKGDLSAEGSEPMGLTAITTPFGLLDRETQEALKAHGGPLQFLNFDGKWQTSDVMDWYANSTYRVKPAPPKPRERWLRINHNNEIRECTEDAEGASLWREVLPD